MTHDRLEPALDQSGDVWTGCFPGLGSIAVGPDGAVDVRPDAQNPEDAYLRAQALRYGWAECLSFVRRGFLIARGAAACPSPTAGHCVLLPGDPHDVAIVLADLVNRGWTIMGDRFTAVRWDGEVLVAEAREAPVLMAHRRADKLGLTQAPVRRDSDTRAVDFPRHRAPTPVRAVVHVDLRRPGDQTLEPLLGRNRFEAAAGIIIHGVLTPTRLTTDEAPTETMRDHLRFSRMPHARLHIEPDSTSDAVTELVCWLAGEGLV